MNSRSCRSPHCSTFPAGGSETPGSPLAASEPDPGALHAWSAPGSGSDAAKGDPGVSDPPAGNVEQCGDRHEREFIRSAVAHFEVAAAPPRHRFGKLDGGDQFAVFEDRFDM